jgi:hypothetical protein
VGSKFLHITHHTQQITQREKINSGADDNGKEKERRKREKCDMCSGILSYAMNDIAELHNKACNLPLGNETLLVICREILITFFLAMHLNFPFKQKL